MSVSNNDGGWCLFRCKCITPGAEDCDSFGVCYRENGKTVWSWQDVDVCREKAVELVARLNRERPEPVHREEIIRDYIEESGK